jgi:hypothetical protein
MQTKFADWLLEFDIEPTDELQAHFWKWATENEYTGNHMLVRVVKRFVDGLDCRIVRND